MNTQKKGISTYDIVAIALMAAFVFVATYFFKIDLPTIERYVRWDEAADDCLVEILIPVKRS